MEDKKLRVAITHGDTNGIGYEVILKAFEDPTMLELCTPIIYGSPKVAAYHRKAMDLQTPFSIVNTANEAADGKLNLLATFDEEIKVELGQPSPEATTATVTALERAMADLQAGAFDVLVAAPANQSAEQDGFDGHARWLQKNAPESDKLLPIYLSEDLRVALVTSDLAIRDVAEAITKQKIVEKAQTLHHTLRRDLRISSPRIAVLALNPHAGENRQLGEEEQEVILPAIEELEQQGIQAFGPYPADEFFGSDAPLRFDAVLAMYYDQGLVPFKSLAPEATTVLYAGLPFVCTTPHSGPGYSIAGQGKADPTALRQALYLALDVCRNRADYDEPLGNPLPKLYKEKRDDSEKVRFAVPKKNV